MSGEKMQEKTREKNGGGAKDGADDSGLRQGLKAFSLLGSVGIYLMVFVGICIFLGYEADVTFGLGTKGRLVGILFGFPAALYSLYRQLRRGTFF